MRVDRTANRKVGVVGAARSGIAAALLLNRHGANVFVSDSKDPQLLGDAVDTLRSRGIEFETGGNTSRVFDGMDYVVISPGIPPEAPIVTQMEAAGIPTISEIELGYWLCDGRIAAITGSNGKTTTTALTGEIFKLSGKPTFVAGNIGAPFCDICDEVPKNGWVILEISSFQLERCYEFRPDIAAVLNLTPDHLDRYVEFSNYAEMKLRIGENQSESDAFVANFDDKYLVELSSRLSGKTHYFSIIEKVDPGVCALDGQLMYHLDRSSGNIMPVSEISLPGPHNLANCAASALIALLADIPKKAIRDALATFKGVEHRLEACGAVASVKFINDSKATNVDSVWYALQSVTGKLVLIMGGRDKAGDFSRLVPLIADRVSAIVLIGEVADKMESAFGNVTSIYRAKDMKTAVRLAYSAAKPDGTVLLSPACASFDMFKDFEHRGHVFKEAVAELQKELG